MTVADDRSCPWWSPRRLPSIKIRVTAVATVAAMVALVPLNVAPLLAVQDLAANAYVDHWPAALRERFARGVGLPDYTTFGTGHPEDITAQVTDERGVVVAEGRVTELTDAVLAEPQWRRAARLVRADQATVSLSNRSQPIVSRNLTAIAVAAMAAIVALATYLAGSRALRPVEHIRRQVEDIRSGPADRRVPVGRGGDEIARLARTMNDMLDRLDAAAQQQARFIADASHELRNPVAAIRAAVEIPLRHPGIDPMEALRNLDRESERLQQVVTDLLDLARLTHAPTTRRAELDLDDIALEEADRTRTLHPGLHVDTGAVSNGRAYGDPAQLTRVVRNLLDNAARHARTQVAVAVSGGDDAVMLVVDDDGPGVPEADRRRIFDPFVRLTPARERSSGGTGLGLALVHSIVDAHAGTIDVAAASIGGARFVVRLPVSGGTEPAPPPTGLPSGNATAVRQRRRPGRHQD